MKKVLFLMLMAMPLFFASCSSDDEEEETVSKSELLGTWYTLEYGWCYVFNESSMTMYEIWESSDIYSLNSYTITRNYTLRGNQLIGEDGSKSTISINGNTMKVTEPIDDKGNTMTATLTKFNGTPQQLIEYLNK